MSIAWLTPAKFTPDAYSVKCGIVCAGRSQGQPAGRSPGVQGPDGAKRELRDELEKLTGVTSCDIDAKPGVKLEDLEAEFWQELDKLQQEGPTADEVTDIEGPRPDRKDQRPREAGWIWRRRRHPGYLQPVHGRSGILAERREDDRSSDGASVKAAAEKYMTKGLR